MCATDKHPNRLRVFGWCANGRHETLNIDIEGNGIYVTVVDYVMPLADNQF